ncbi:phosphatase PAP2 family protein [Nocardioides sp. B-3]|uniref:phosphatase PAP2 family protein n=1 Tax=Nocardioides sp. B-3 TaxID=2895565 RepID=UPI002152C7BB|nr:phosphatase PAP2 family protein [Nocardioides sp. B-3]UUZ61596.1 phosphatase PAP2 family protein [Nocardioides sp. B-3]
MFVDVERDVVAWFVEHDVVGLLAAYYYATAHYVVTAVVLGWLYRRRASLYPRARQILIGSTLVALVAYLLMPTAPPRLVGFPDLMAMHADSGWWGEAASAPQGVGWMTNQLAAFPSMHAGWSLWVALAVTAATTHRALRAAARGTRGPDRDRRRRHRQPLAARRPRRLGHRPPGVANNG